MSNEYHLRFDPPTNGHWPDGAVTVYQITGSQIADREIRSEIIKPERGPAYYSGEVIARHSWCGYVGMFKTLPEAVAAIEKHRAEQTAMEAKQAARKSAA